MKYAEMWLAFTTVETEAIGATVYLAHGAPRGVNPIGQVVSVAFVLGAQQAPRRLQQRQTRGYDR